MTAPEHIAVTDHSEPHIVSVRFYVGIFLALLCLTFVTYEVARIDLGRMNIVVALLIAGVKSTLVALFFMHAYHSPRRTKLVIIAGISWLATMILLTMGDYFTRIPHWPPR